MTAVFVWSIAGPLVGFAFGFFSFKVKTRWCTLHGVVKVCPDCIHSMSARRA